MEYVKEFFLEEFVFLLTFLGIRLKKKVVSSACKLQYILNVIQFEGNEEVFFTFAG